MNNLNHIAIIADGNGRWAEAQGWSRSEGHEAGLYKIEDIAKWCVKAKIPIFSIYCFSIENWNRPKEEVDNLIRLAHKYFDRYKEFKDNNVKVVVSGTKERLDEETLEKIKTVQEYTKDCDGLILNLCCNYSGQKEIEEAVAAGARTIEEISAAMYNQLPPPDLIIRTGGRRRLSNFMLWQAAYAELHFTPTLFPDFTQFEFNHIIQQYKNESRTFGGVMLT